MSILNKITPGPWFIDFNGKFYQTYPQNGRDPFITVNDQNVLPKGEAQNNAYAVGKVPEMLSIIERLAKRTEIDPVIDIKAEAQHLLNQLNKEL